MNHADHPKSSQSQVSSLGKTALQAEDIHQAARRLEGVAHRTPVFSSHSLNRLARAQVVLKTENLQRTGSFKFRGAYNAVTSLGADASAKGVCAFSSGNHAQAIALASTLAGAHATILMPEDAPIVKRQATEGYGARVITFDRYRDDRSALAAELADREGLTLVHAFDNVQVMAGQGTVALELIADTDPIDVLVVPVSGGGLIAGCATIARELHPTIQIVGVEPESGDDTARSFAAGHRVHIPVPRTIADGLQAETPGAITYPIVRQLVSSIVTVSDSQIAQAMQILFERLKVVVEPSGAAGLAAVLSHPDKFTDRRVGVILTGGNISADSFSRTIAAVASTDEQ